MSKYRKTGFNSTWLTHPLYSSWICEVPADKFAARCSICNTTFSLSNMGKQAITSHMKGKKHSKATASCATTLNVTAFFNRSHKFASVCEPASTNQNLITTTPSSSGLQVSTSSACTSNTQQSESQSGAHSKRRSLEGFLVMEDVTRAEVLWCIQSVMNHTSMGIAGRDVTLFKKMFPDSDIASKMKLQHDKIGYTLTFGIASHFEHHLLQTVSQCDHFVVGFDELLNKVSQKQQMDVNIRFWDSTKEEVCTRYLTSAFLGHTKASDMLIAFKNALSGLCLKKIIQISMDGPNVNFKFLRDLKSDIKSSPNDPVIIDIGSCGLHTMHGAFKAAIQVTEWRIIEFLRAIYNLFKAVPARRAQYTQYSGSDQFPQKFCAIRWVENIKVAQRAIDILPHLRAFVNGVVHDKKTPNTASFRIVASIVEDKLLAVKLAFFKSLAAEVEPFLRGFQSDMPLAPFLYNTLLTVLRNVMDRFVKPEVLNATAECFKVDVMLKENLLPARSINLGFATRDAMKRCPRISDLQFRQECKTSLQKFALKLTQRSPLQYKMTKAMSCLDPNVAGNPKIGCKRLTSLLAHLVENNWLDGTSADRVEREYKQICSETNVIDNLKSFSRGSEHVDHFWKRIFQNHEEAKHFEGLVKMMLIFSHGNVNVERGFPVNAECLSDNLRNETLVARRRVYDTINALGGIEEFTVSKALIHSAINARARFSEALVQRKKEAAARDKEHMEKKRAAEFMKELEAKKARTIEAAQKGASMMDDEIKTLKK